MKLIIIKFVIVFLLFNIYSFSQQKYYISSSTGSDSNDGLSTKSAWKTLTKLDKSWHLIHPGDSILFKRGDIWAPDDSQNKFDALIRPPVGKSGTKAKYIFIGAYGNGEKPTISSEYKTNYHRSIYFRHNSYFIVKDLKILGNKITVRNHINWPGNGSHHIKFLYLDYDGSYGHSNKNQILFQNPIIGKYKNPPEKNRSSAPLHNIEIGYCTFKNNSTKINDMINATAPDSNFWIHHNKFHNINEDAIDLGGGKDHIVEFNTISGVSNAGIKIHSQFSKADKLIIRGNFIIHCGGSTGSKSWGLVLQGIQNSLVYNNTIVSKRSAWFGDREETYQPLHHGYFNNNVIFNNIFAGSVLIAGKLKKQMYKITEQNIFSHNIYTLCPDIYISDPFKSLIQIDYSEIIGKVSYKYIGKETFKSEWISRRGINQNESTNDPEFISSYWYSPKDYGDFRFYQDSPAAINGKLNQHFYKMVGLRAKFYRGAFPPILKLNMEKIEPDKKKGQTKLYQNYPNPFNPTTQIKFSISNDSKVKLIIYNILGDKIETLINSHLQQGMYNITFHSRNLPSGIYVYYLSTNNYAISKKFIILK